MNGDVQVRFSQIVKELGTADDLPQLWAMREHLEGHMLMLDGLRLNNWRREGYAPAPAGLRCEHCGGATWHKSIYSPTRGEVELVRCVGLGCGALKEVRV